MHEYIAHIDEKGKFQTIKEHLINTAEMASAFSEGFGMENEGYIAGLLHDIGKYSDEFQKYINNGGGKIDHSTAGAKECVKRKLIMPAFCIASHHSGLKSWQVLGERIQKKNIPNYNSYKTDMIDDLVLRKIYKEDERNNDIFHIMFMVRMLFSSLVDADYLDTERFMSGKDREGYDSLNELKRKLDVHLLKFANSQNELNKVRSQILQECLQAAHTNRNLFSLTVPTGGGKTWSSMAFALNHAVKFGKERIIYVIPYTSIIEQTVDLFRNVFGNNNVLEHHSNADFSIIEDKKDEELQKLATENWDIPIIVTTNVQFFESLFACKNSKCRKLHNIANSVIVFDEAQMLPISYIKPCIRVMTELIHNCNSTVLLCTATQPNLQQFFCDDMIFEIMTNPTNLFKRLKRTNIQFDGKYSLSDMARKLEKEKQVLCIVNLKNSAEQLFRIIDAKEKFHLSTNMSPKHRREVLGKICERLKNKLPCIVIATSVLEAGVDIDFPIVYREVNGLDSILQAAGRCNREGKNSAESSIVHIFELEDIPEYITKYKRALDETRHDFKAINTPEAIERYFYYLYKQQESVLNCFDEKKIISMHNRNFDFEKIATEFRMIDNRNQKSVIVIRKEDYQQTLDLINQLIYGKRTKDLMRKLSPYIINAYENVVGQLLTYGAVQRISDDLFLLEGDIDAYYDKDTGVNTKPEGGNAFIF